MPEELENIIKQGEGYAVDFKESGILSDPLKLAKLMVAFANNLYTSEKYGGLILIGVRNDGSLEGMKKKQGHEEHLMNIARDKCEPPIKPQFEAISLVRGDVYVLTIPRMSKYPHAVKLQDGNVYYVRVGTTVRVAAPVELQGLFTGTGKPTVNQIIQRVRESVPSISCAYRSVIVAPDHIVKDLIRFDEEIDYWLRSISNSLDLVIGNPHSTQDGVIFKVGNDAVHECFAKITREGVIYYREPISGEKEGIHIGRTIRVVVQMLEYAQKVYERFKYIDSCVIKLELGNIKNMPLIADGFWPRRDNFTFDDDKVLVIERELPNIQTTQCPTSIVESIVIEFCRSFGFSMAEEIAKKYVARYTSEM